MRNIETIALLFVPFKVYKVQYIYRSGKRGVNSKFMNSKMQNLLKNYEMRGKKGFM